MTPYNSILEDAKLISKYLGINCPKFKFNSNSTDGLTLEDITHLGTKGNSKYTRRLLIHELLHTRFIAWRSGYQHTNPSNFFSSNVNDFGLVDFILKMCFNEEK